MKRIVLLAPAAIEPLTEGRKRLVMDLAQKLRERSYEVEILTGEPRGRPWMMVLRSLSSLKTLLARDNSVVVAMFPFGTFDGLRGYVNDQFIRSAKAICDKAAVRSLPVFYSCAGISLEKISERYAPGVIVGRRARGMRVMHLGIPSIPEAWSPRGKDLRRLLFLCGYQEASRGSFKRVLKERGLAELLECGDQIAQCGIELSIAVPMLRDERMKQLLRAHISRKCSTLKYEVLSEVDVISLFRSHDAFAFPYGVEHASFIPTSLLEALSLGVPTVAADLPMYAELTKPNCEKRCILFRQGDSQDLARALRELSSSYEKACESAHNYANELVSAWNLDVAADEFIAALSEG